jgi:hypothetical protein
VFWTEEEDKLLLEQVAIHGQSGSLLSRSKVEGSAWDGKSVSFGLASAQGRRKGKEEGGGDFALLREQSLSVSSPLQTPDASSVVHLN